MRGSSNGSCGSRALCGLPRASVECVAVRDSSYSTFLPSPSPCLLLLPPRSFAGVPLNDSVCLIPSWRLLLGGPEPTQKLQNSIPPNAVASSLLLLAWVVHPHKTEEMKAPLLKGEAVRLPPTTSRQLLWRLWKSSLRSSPEPASSSNGTCHLSGLLAQKPRQKLRGGSRLA